jgi:type I restriction enzyme S subunit
MGKPMATSQDFVNWVCSEAIDHRFLKYVLVAERNAFLRFASGTTHQTIYFPEVKAFHICLPPIDEQRSIAGILTALDDKIELNRVMSETLQAIVRAWFESWFVRFDPVHAKVRGESTGSLEPFADLFPHSFDDSEIGPIPTGWRVTQIGNLAEIKGGSTPSTTESRFWRDGTHYWATPKDLASLSTPVLLETERKISDAGLTQIGSGLLPPGTVLLSSRAPIGYLAVAEVPVAINQGFIAMLPRNRMSNLFLFFWTQCNQDRIVARANGSTFMEISKTNFRPIPAVEPPTSILQAFDSLARPFYDRIVANERDSRVLVALRDTLLPKLISGELRVSDPARFVKQTA